MKKYTAKQLLKKYHGKYIDTYAWHEYNPHRILYEVRGISAQIRENHNLPEDCIIK